MPQAKSIERFALADQLFMASAICPDYLPPCIKNLVPA